jgi:hypothetical protein
LKRARCRFTSGAGTTSRTPGRRPRTASFRRTTTGGSGANRRDRGGPALLRDLGGLGLVPRSSESGLPHDDRRVRPGLRLRGHAVDEHVLPPRNRELVVWMVGRLARPSTGRPAGYRC